MKKFKKLALSIVSFLMAVTCVSGVFTMSDISADAASHKHTYDTVLTEDQKNNPTVASTCQKKGYVLVECKDEDCTKTKKVYLDKLEHVAPEGNTIEKPATCNAKGYDRFKCVTCEKNVRVPKDKLEHQFDSDVEVVEATCKRTGYKKGKCSNCQKVKKVILKKADHAIDIEKDTPDAKLSKAPTCTKAGKNVFVCKNDGCNKKQTVKVPALNHDTVLAEGSKDATCLEAGYISKVTCTRCDYKVENKKIPARGHTLTKVDPVSKCEYGYHGDTYYTCSTCGEHTHSNKKDAAVCTKVDCDLSETNGTGHTYDEKGVCTKKECKKEIEGLYYLVGETVYTSLEAARAAVKESEAEDSVVLPLYDAKDLKAFAALVNGGESCADITVELKDDVKFKNDAKTKEDETVWTPIGTLTAPFSGKFDGKGNKVSNFTVEGNENVGFFGYITGDVSNLEIRNATIKGNKMVGGIVGAAYGNIVDCKVYNCEIICTPLMNDNGDDVGGIVGYACDATCKVQGNTVKSTEITGYRDIGGIAGTANNGAVVEGNTVGNLKLFQSGKNAYEGEYKDTIYAIVGRKLTADENIKKNEKGSVKIEHIDFVNYVLIETKVDLKKFAKDVNDGNSYAGKTIMLMADIDLNGAKWTPIGTKEVPFAGTFLGMGHTISNFKVEGNEGVGFFGYIKNGVVDSLKIDDAKIKGNHYVAGIVGYAYGSVNNCKVTNSEIICTIEKIGDTYDNGDKVGGIVGYLGEGVYSVSNNLVENVSLKGYRDIGGIVGRTQADNVVSKNTVKAVKITQDLANGYYDESVGKTNGPIIGNGGAELNENEYADVELYVVNFTEPKAEIKDGAIETVTIYDLSNGSATGEATLETSYVFVATETVEAAKLSFFAHWIADYYVSVDKDVAAGTIGLAGAYDSYEEGAWIGFYSPIDVKAGEKIGLLERTGGTPWTYAEIVEFVGEFRCGAFDLNGACAGVTLTVELRLTNPENKEESITICVKEYTFAASEAK